MDELTKLILEIRIDIATLLQRQEDVVRRTAQLEAEAENIKKTVWKISGGLLLAQAVAAVVLFYIGTITK